MNASVITDLLVIGLTWRSMCRSGRQRAARVVRCGERGSPRAAHGLAPHVGLRRLQVEPSEHHIPTAYPDRVEKPTGRELSGDRPGGVQVGRVEEAARITALAKRASDASMRSVLPPLVVRMPPFAKRTIGG